MPSSLVRFSIRLREARLRAGVSGLQMRFAVLARRLEAQLLHLHMRCAELTKRDVFFQERPMPW